MILRLKFRHSTKPYLSILLFFLNFIQGENGEIRHLFRGYAFLYSRKVTQNGGMFVCHSRDLLLAGGTKVCTRIFRRPDFTLYSLFSLQNCF